MIGAVMRSPVAIFESALASHFLLDLLPHIDSETFAAKHRPYSIRQLSTLFVDTTVSVLLVMLFFSAHMQWQYILLGGLAAVIPDLLIPFERFIWYRPLRDFHWLCHWNFYRAKRWSWYIAGLATPAVIGVASLAIIWLTWQNP